MATATLQLRPPDRFDFKQPDNWSKWKKRFEQFRIASGLAKDDEARQVSTLLYCLGEEAEDVLASTRITDDEMKKYTSVLTKFDEFFQVRKNVIFERAKFNRRNQRENESIEEYLTALYAFVKSCDYGDLQEQLLRDRIVVGIWDTTLSERMQMDADLSLEKAKRGRRTARTAAARRRQQKVTDRRRDGERSDIKATTVDSTRQRAAAISQRQNT